MNFVRQSLFGLLIATPALSFAQEADGLRPMRGLRTTSFWEQNWPWLTALIVVGVIALIVLTVWLVKRKPVARTLSPAEEARLRLGEAASLATQQDDKAFSVTVSDALRVYMERAFHLRAPEQTTEEFLQHAKQSQRLPEQSLTTLAKFLELCDLAKFAQHAFGDDERKELLNTARNFVDEAEQRAKAATPEVTA
ncbi:DUF4381 family protein [Cerasicoccus maritimus]|uniref:DUF4381 family protein n=1 Tax=Cerasicoccus maritimus TaxID=490089 RepID=UPI0028529BD4|nr:DUF4381 family protein [Cerasicoccus maritimus]